MFDAAILRGFRKAVRTAVQLIASGALTVAVNAFAGGLAPGIQTLVGTVWLFIVTFLQNGLEAAGKIPVLLPTAPVGTPAPTAEPPTADPAV